MPCGPVVILLICKTGGPRSKVLHKEFSMTEETTKFVMEYGANRPSKRSDRRQALLWRLWTTRQECRKEIARRKREAKCQFNTENKPLGA